MIRMRKNQAAIQSSKYIDQLSEANVQWGQFMKKIIFHTKIIFPKASYLF